MRALLLLLLSGLVCRVCTTSIQEYVDQAVRGNSDQVTIPPGIYYATLGSYGVHLNISNVKNFAIYAYGVTMVCTVRARAIDITDTTNVSIHGLTVDYNPLTFTQGTIVALTPTYLDLKIHDGYPVVAWNRINIVDQKTGFFKDGVGFIWDSIANITQPGVVRISRTMYTGFYNAEVGDYASLAGGPDGNYACHGIGINFCISTTLIDVTIYCAPGFGLAEWGGYGGLVLRNFRIAPGPPPPGATEPRLLSSSWDGIEHSATTVGAIVTNMTVIFAGDDTWSAVGSHWEIAEIDFKNQALVLGNGDASFILQVGNRLRLRNADEYPSEEVVVTKIVDTPLPHDVVFCARCLAKANREIFISPNFTVYVDRPIPTSWNASDNLCSLDRESSGFVLRNSYVYSKGRGALVKATNGLIENNYFRGGTAGVEVSPELNGASGSDACVGYDLIIRNNVIVHTGYHETFDDPKYGPDGAIAFFSYTSNTTELGPIAFRNMLIDSNVFDSVNGINIGITSGNGIVITNNTFFNTQPVNYSVQGQDYGFHNGYVVFITETNNITLSNNIVNGNGRFKVGNLYVSPTVTNIFGAKTGISQTNSTNRM